MYFGEFAVPKSQFSVKLSSLKLFPQKYFWICLVGTPGAKLGAPEGDGEAPTDSDAVAVEAAVAVGVRPVVTVTEFDVPTVAVAVGAPVAVGVRPVVTVIEAEAGADPE